MARFKEYSYSQGVFKTIFFEKQILPGTFEYALHYLIDNEVDLSVFKERYKNDKTGAKAYDPAILLKIILYAYSKGIVSSRKIAQCCKENVIFMALSADTCPHFTTIADFISSLDKEAVHLFRDILLVCDRMGLIGREMFAIDGCKLPSNASKEWSGTRADFKKKAVKMEKAIANILKKHREHDEAKSDPEIKAKEKKYVETLKKRVKKIKEWLDNNDDKIGKSGKPIKSNITDNESAKMKTSKGVIQGYNGVTAVDGKHQVIVHAESFGQGNEQDLLKPMIDGVRANFRALDKKGDVFRKAKLLADSGFYSKKNMELLFEEGIDGYVADPHFRKRDPRFADIDRYKERFRRERAKEGRKKLFGVDDFFFPDDLSYCICPAGKRLYRSGGNVISKGEFRSVRFKGPKSACLPCKLRFQCLRHPERTEIRQVAYFLGRTEKSKDSFAEKMKRKIDSVAGRMLYGMRLAIAEPPFAHLRSVLGLDRFTLRGRKKVNIQWNLFCLIHNLKKIHVYGAGFA
jgi:transposase